MLARLERLEKENSLLMKVIMELNHVIDKERGNEFNVYVHDTIGTKTAAVSQVTSPAEPVSEESLPPWRIRK
jgi:hypothetical protein